MTRQAISTGSSANDGTGDTLRSASGKINDNFVELYNFLGGDNDTLASKVSLNDSAIVFSGLGLGNAILKYSGGSGEKVIDLPSSSGTIVVDTANQTLTNKILTAPAMSDPVIGGSIKANAGDEIIELGDAGSLSVNHIKVSNATTGNHAKIEATGDDANVNLLLEGKTGGTGAVDIKRVALRSTSLGVGGSYTSTHSHVILTGGTYTSDLADGTVEGEVVVFTNSAAGIKTIEPDNFAQGSTIALDQYDAVTLIWDGSNWYIAGHYGATVA